MRDKDERGNPEMPDVDVSSAVDVESDDSLLCRACGAIVTADRHGIAVNSDHHHTFFNPAGIVFEIRCFRQAAGTIIHGPPTTDFTWFQGYSWQYCLCAHCLIHLGWYFGSADDGFYGLIGSKLLRG
ncbi:MAG TPA: hypothetical protein ENN06_01200 [Desulfobacteraceae bacterium]|nr:hypothetical protein [Desulfobacteraceae bacterium]